MWRQRPLASCHSMPLLSPNKRKYVKLYRGTFDPFTSPISPVLRLRKSRLCFTQTWNLNILQFCIFPHKAILLLNQCHQCLIASGLGNLTSCQTLLSSFGATPFTRFLLLPGATIVPFWRKLGRTGPPHAQP